MKVTMCDICKFNKKDIDEEPCISCSANKGRFELDLAEHDKQIRAEVIEEYKLKLLNAKTDLVKDIHKAKIWVEFKRQAIDIAEQLKEQNSIIEALKPRGCADMPKEIVCNCTKEQK